MTVFIYINIACRSLLKRKTDLDNIEGCKEILDYSAYLLKQNNINSKHILDSYVKNIKMKDVDEFNMDKIKKAIEGDIRDCDAICYLDFESLGKLAELTPEFRSMFLGFFKPIKPLTLLLQEKSSGTKIMRFIELKREKYEKKRAEKEKTEEPKEKKVLPRKLKRKKEIDICR